MEGIKDKVAEIFEKAGFSINRDVAISEFDFDLIAELDFEGRDFKIIFGFVQDMGKEEVREMVSRCIGLNKKCETDEIIIVCQDCEFYGEDKYRALQDKIFIWRDELVDKYYEMFASDSEDARLRLLSLLGLKVHSDSDWEHMPHGAHG